MKRGRKILLAAASLLAAAVISAVILATVEISSPRLDAALSDRAGEMLGAPFSTGGVSLRLTRGITARRVTLGPPGQEFFTAEKIAMKANLLQLARRKIDIEAIVIEKPVVTMGANGFFMPPVLPAEAEDPASGFKFSLKSVELRSGRVASLENGKTKTLAENVFIRARSEGAGEPVNIHVEADMLGAMRLEAAGSIASIREPVIDIKCSLEADWDAVGAFHPSAGGSGKSVFTVSLSGAPEGLDILAAGDLTGEEISFGNSFLKPAGTRTSASARAFLSYPRLEVERAEAKLGDSIFTLDGRACFESGAADLALDGIISLEDAAACVPALQSAGAAGSGKLDAVLEKRHGLPARVGGKCAIRDWRIIAAGGDELNFEFSLIEDTLRITNLAGRIGGGILTGYGMLTLDGEYEFAIEGVDIDIEQLLKQGKSWNQGFGISGSAGMAASVKSRGGGIEHIRGEGVFQADDGMITTLPWAEGFFTAANLNRLFPLNYERIRGDFLMQKGILTADAFLRSDRIHVEADKAEFDLINMNKVVHADIMLPPASIENLRDILGDIHKILYVDARGYAHAGLVWDGELSETTPNMAASLMRTGQKRIRQMLGL